MVLLVADDIDPDTLRRALMDAGAPIKAPVAGVAMGLIKEDDRVAVLTDILGDEDHLGDMDFKVAGTVDGINALQMDIKIDGITREIMEVALDQAGHVAVVGLDHGGIAGHEAVAGQQRLPAGRLHVDLLQAGQDVLCGADLFALLPEGTCGGGTGFFVAGDDNGGIKGSVGQE